MASLSIISKVIDGSAATELGAIRRELTEMNANLGAARIDAQALPDGAEKDAKLQAINDAIAEHRDAVNAANETIAEYNNVRDIVSVMPGVNAPTVNEVGLMGMGSVWDDLVSAITTRFGDIGALLQNLWNTMLARLESLRSAVSYALQKTIVEPFQTVQTGINLGMAAVAVGVGALVIYVLSKAGTKEGRAQMKRGHEFLKEMAFDTAKDYSQHVKQTKKEAIEMALKVAPFLV